MNRGTVWSCPSSAHRYGLSLVLTLSARERAPNAGPGGSLSGLDDRGLRIDQSARGVEPRHRDARDRQGPGDDDALLRWSSHSDSFQNPPRGSREVCFDSAIAPSTWQCMEFGAKATDFG